MTAATSIAISWWNASEERPIVGRLFTDLFRFEVLAETKEDRELQWSLLTETKAPIELELAVEDEAQLEEAAEPTFATVILEKLDPPQGEAVFAALVTRHQGASAVEMDPVAAPAAQPADDSGCYEDLDEAEQVGLFSIVFPEGRCHYSPGWKRLLGYRPHELADDYNTYFELTHPEDSEAAPDRPTRGEPGSRVGFSVEFRMRHKDGHYLWIQSAGVRYYGLTGQLERVTGVHLNIQERKEVEEQCLQNEERFLTLVQHGNAGFFDLDYRVQKAFFSPGWCRMLGYAENDLHAVPETFRRLIDAEASGAEQVETLFANRMTETRYETFSLELRMIRSDGSRVDLPTHLVRVSNRRGELLRILGFQTDVPKALLGAGPEVLRAALNDVNEGVIVTDADSKVIFFNAKASDLTGLDPKIAAGRSLENALSLVFADGGRPAGNLADRVLAAGDEFLFSREYLLEHPEHGRRQIIVSARPLRDANSRITGAVVVFRDPEEMSLTPEELVKSNRMEALGMLASGVAHDFNNLLTTIVGGISLGRELREWDKLESAERAGLSAKNLTRQLLTFARSRSTDRKAICLTKLVNDCVRLSASGSPVKTEVRLADDLHPVFVNAPRVSQVFQNLIINAIQGIDRRDGKILITGDNVVIRAGQHPNLKAGDYLRIDVIDNGRGIPRENLRRIFEPFFSTKKTGTGLGLATVASIVNDHGGRIEVESEVGKGTKFSVYLPKSEEPVEAEGRRKPALTIGSGKILFMDDDPEIISLAQGMLQRLEYECDVARNGEEALALYRRYLAVQRPYDVVILDLTIVGGMGGEETFEELRKLDPDVRAIVSSGYSSDDTEEYYLNKGFYGVLSKPYRSSEMGKLLRRVLGKDPVEEQPEEEKAK